MNAPTQLDRQTDVRERPFFCMAVLQTIFLGISFPLYAGGQNLMIYGYGEDALTLYAMTKGFPAFLDQLQDRTRSDRAVIYFRPSFGRRSPNPNATPSVFGEFDAIVVTEGATYLVEAKWNSSTELKETTLTVADRQRRRHEVFRWYHD